MAEIPDRQSAARPAIKRSRVGQTVLAQQTTGGNDSKSALGLPSLRFEVPEAARILRMSRAALYIRIGRGAIKAQKDGARAYITLTELERYVASCD